mmetsp:Transcript_13927/g.30087  ORF Transcript_13927/g.30087 Transcript_13927/m.30087 type:complete len:382 (-) Transcript_13927:747-1892(-)|eukprot:CAMPEP_0202889872 /NCGR_PEP_ID=MMETSP1392-20130828/420_1 /ASSEMBLY_ACC=CAM_ASM_000868 /TAXON_ID=225041 /ORGANISM="Chlamydomonas chlamydogama, Strain SAG 11-48b" /LENGTH=381 /DNA_ID=CAMNT_0049573303 /DNA_START=220 /DNA_END=1365 /DNA_ORIENTATION=-
MLRSVSRPAVCYDLVGLSADGVVTVGRESESHIRLDSADVPFLLSRKHATLQFQPDGTIILRDLNSTNGTYVAHRLQQLEKLAPNRPWELEAGDTIGFGGPEVISARRVHVSNPFLFKYYPAYDEEMPQQANAIHDAQNIPVNPSPQAAALPGQDAAVIVAHPQPSQDNDIAHVSGDQQHCHTLHLNQATEVLAALRRGLPPSSNMAASPGMQHKRTFDGKENQAGDNSAMFISPKRSKIMDVLANHFTCPICHEWPVACHALSCGHMFCGLCLATWLTQKSTCPTCRKPLAGIPVRCFQVDNALSELLGMDLMSPSAKHDRKNKQRHWDDIQKTVVQDWAMSLQLRKQQAIDAAARHHRSMMGNAAAAGGGARAADAAGQ